MSNLVIVAIPEEQDRVWKISSEEVPHLTLLYLGDVGQVQNLDQIMQFVDHAVTLSEHGPFYLDVDRRGTLGDKEADVLFFNKRSWNLKWIRQFRGQLLQNQAIRTAFDQTDQVVEAPQEWLPHLTLGYPGKPAKELPDNGFDHPLYSVCFDRIAVWDTEFDGPEFQLEWPERELDGDLAVAYSDQQKAALMHNGALSAPPASTALARGEEFVEHHGVKGMRWGVRKSEEGGAGLSREGVKKGAKTVLRKGAHLADDVLFEAQKKDEHVRDEILDRANDKLRDDLPGIKAKHGEYGKLRQRAKKPFSKEARAYRKDVKDTYLTHLESSANELTNLRSTRRYTLKEKGKPNTSKYYWQVSTEAAAAAHAATDSGTRQVQPIFDEEGYIVDIKPVKDALAQSIEYGESFVHGLIHGSQEPGEAFVDEMVHYGVKGMRWGHTSGDLAGGFRRSPPQAVAPQAHSKVPHGKRRKTKVETEGGENHPASEDAIKVAEAHAKLVKSGPKALSNKELRDVATRVQLEQQAIQATRPSASKWVRSLLKNQGNQVVNAKIQSKVNPQTKKK